ncbi:hypothetical protein TNIN_101831 [Trichonephila inaurata madagascariensis]|uniref:Uncharacterized protein n=1 Tax=Trichonephila inaurata madagascariensis TaxID=2747483 RepID=A0A8X6K302_9ARAC|nr:hypothetical protein TNIN_101831 [Trichonephila inaurata madagascariensis]
MDFVLFRVRKERVLFSVSAPKIDESVPKIRMPWKEISNRSDNFYFCMVPPASGGFTKKKEKVAEYYALKLYCKWDLMNNGNKLPFKFVAHAVDMKGDLPHKLKHSFRRCLTTVNMAGSSVLT